MSLPSDYVNELNILNKKIAADQPKDVIEYCASYFTNRLMHKRQSGFRNTSLSGPSNQGFSFQLQSFDRDSEDPRGKVNDEGIDPSSMFKNSFSNDPISPHHSAHLEDDCLNSNHEPPASFVPLRRSSVSAEALNPNVFENDNWRPPYHELSESQLSRLNKSIVKNFLFSNLEDDALNTVLHALKEQSFPEGSIVIKQGDEGEYFYLIEKGEVDYYVNDQKVNSGGPGASFGELALMYSAPRAATVKAKTDLIVWALDRLTFRRVLLEVTAKKRLMYEEFLKDVKLLSELSSYQRSKLADALQAKFYKPGAIIIQEGDVGENFYLIESGDADVIKKSDGVVATIHKGDYFGEIALLNDLPRQATVQAKTNVKVATLGKSGFQRLLGPVVDVLKAQDPRKDK